MFRRLLWFTPVFAARAYKRVPCGSLGHLAVAICKLLTRNSTTCSKSKKTELAIPNCIWSSLENGMRVITEETCSPLACVTLLADVGSRFESPENNGVSHFIEHMVCGGFGSLKGCAFEEHMKDISSHLYIHTSRDHQAFIFTCPQDMVKYIISLIPKMLFELECDIVDVRRALLNVKQQLMELEYNTKQLCFDYLHQTAFQGTPLARAPLGRYSNYQHFGKGFLQAFIAERYQPCSLVLSVSSIFCHDEVKCWTQVAFENHKQTCIVRKDTPCRYTGSMTSFRDDTMPFCHVALAVETGGYISKDYLTLQLMKHIIGRWDNSQSLGNKTWPMLAHAFALSKLCHNYEAFYLPYRDVGLWGVYFVIKKEDDYEDAIFMIQDQWMKLYTTTAFADVNRAAAALKLEMAKAVDGCVASCMDMGLQMLHVGERKNLIQLNKIVKLLEYPEVRYLADSILYDRCPVISAFGPTEAIPDYSRIRGGMH